MYIVKIYYVVPRLNKLVSAWVRDEFAPDSAHNATAFETYTEAAKHVESFGMDNIREVRIYNTRS